MKKRFEKIYIEITNICNLKCEFCTESIRIKKYMKISEFEEIIQKVKLYTNLVCLHVKGEPLLHPHLKEILKIIEENNLQVSITTNATLLKQQLETLQSSKSVKQINLSIHSITQNSNLKFEEYFNNICNAVKILNNKTNIMVSYRLWNLNTIKENNINKKIIKVLEQEYNLKNLEQELKENTYIKLKEKIFINQDLQFKWPSMESKDIIQTGRCMALKQQIAILVDGTVVPCCLDHNANIKLGNIYQNSLEEIINCEKAQEIIKGFEQNKLMEVLCKKCGFLQNLENKRKQ